MQKAERELIEEKFKGVYLHQTTNFDAINKKLDEIHIETKKTNGRVTKLENDLKFFKWLAQYPKMTTTFSVLFLLLLIHFSDKIDLIKLIFKMF